MSWTPNDETRARDRDRKRRAYEPKTERGQRQATARALLVRVNQLLGCKLAEIHTRRPELMADISVFLATETKR